MVHPKILEHFKCGPLRLREIFTQPYRGMNQPKTPAEESVETPESGKTEKKPGEIRKRFETFIRNSIMESVTLTLKDAQAIQAIDIALDGPTVQKETFPLMLFARGKISWDSCKNALETASLSSETASKFIKRGPDGKVLNISAPRINELNIDLVRSYLTRRLAAMDALWANLWPLYRYDSRGKEPVSMLRADVTTQRVDQISDSYNYRHHDSQCRRAMLAYGRSLTFAEKSWDKQEGWRFERSNVSTKDGKPESYVIREGVSFVNPHPLRTGFDSSAPLANINTDTGPRWLFHWNVIRFSSIKNDPSYWNINDVFVSERWSGITKTYGGFFNQYFSDPCVLTYPGTNTADPTLGNDRNANIGLYSSSTTEAGVLVAPFYMKINPKVEGIGDYDADVWIRFVVAGDCTIVAAEFMPSIPACYGAINWDDGRLSNQSMAAALLGYQDQASTIMTNTIAQLRNSMMQLVLIEKDSLTPEIAEAMEDNINNPDWWVDPKVLIYSATALQNMGIQSPSQAFQIIQNQITNVFDSGLRALNQLLDLADRLLVLSPNELGQPNPREVSAQEVQQIGGSVQSIYAFINQGPREQIAAKKELIFDSLICHGTDMFSLPVENEYELETIKRAGFDVPTETGMDADSQRRPTKTTIIGNLRDLNYDYYFDSRDGAERTSNPQAALAINQMFMAMTQNRALQKVLGARQIVAIQNLIIRLSGTPWPLTLRVKDGATDEVEDPSAQIQAENQAAQSGDTETRIRTLEQALSQMAGMLQGQQQAGGAQPVPPQQALPQRSIQDPAQLAA